MEGSVGWGKLLLALASRVILGSESAGLMATFTLSRLWKSCNFVHDMEARGPGLISDSTPTSARMDCGNHEQQNSGQTVFGPRYELETC
jgi:hypothetical protein